MFKDNNRKSILGLLLLSSLTLFLCLMVSQVSATVEGFCIGEDCVYNWWGTGTTNYLSRWTSSQTIADSVVYQSGSNIGIGTTSPAQKLHVAGYARADSGFCIGTSCITAWPEGEVTGTGTANYLPIWTTSSNIGNSVVYQSGSNVGIGVTSPGAKLDISGGLNLSDRLYTLKDNVRTFENVAQYYAGSTPTTGTVVVTIGNTPNIMLEGEIVIQGYGTLTRCHFRGYTYTGSTTWHMPAATCLSSQASGGYTVRFGKRASDNARVILIGTTSSNWGSYPHISVTRVTYGYPGSGSSIGDWSISIVTDESAYTSISSVNVNTGFKAYNPVFDGNIGIGTTAPAQKLHVAGYARADSGFCIGTSCITAWPEGEVTGTGTANYLPIWTTSSNIGNSVVYQSGSNIGIGTTSPQDKLDVSGAIRLTANTTFISGAGPRIYRDSALGLALQGYAGTTNNFSVFTPTGSRIIENPAGTNNIVLGFSGGSVGIGTTTPAQKLHVAGYARADSGFCIGTSCITAWPQGEVTGAGTANYLPRWTTSSNIGNSVIYQSGSNIGIGTTSPNQQLEITGNFRVATTTYANQSGVIYKGTTRFIHDFNYGYNGTVTTEGRNTFVGINAGNFTMGSTATSSSQASYNTGIGYQALSANTTGYDNVAIGANTLYSNTSGRSNSAIGSDALRANTTGFYNSAIGDGALRANTTGWSNSAMGLSALFNNTTGYYNTAMGREALQFNTTGSYNSAIGATAGQLLASGGFNETSSESVFLGYDTRASVAGGTNEIVIGASAIGAGSNSVVLGNNSITKTLLKGNVGIGLTSPSEKLDVNGNVRAHEFYYSSDASLKTGIGYLPGEQMLSKVLELQGVSFNWKETGEKSIGFIAQDVEKIFPEAVATDSNGLKSISYTKLIAPLTEAIKEQQKQIELLRAELEALKNKEVKALKIDG